MSIGGLLRVAGLMPAGLMGVAALCAVAGALVWRRRERPGAGALVALLASLAVWNAGYALELAAATLEAKLWWARAQYAGIVSVPVAVLAFALDYRGGQRPGGVRRLLPFTVVPALLLVGVWTNDWHGLVWRDTAVVGHPGVDLLVVEHGPLFYLGMVHAYALLLASSALLVSRLFPVRGYYRWEFAVILAAIVAPWLGNALYVFDLLPGPRLDYTTLGFAVSGLMLAVGCLRWRLLEVMPVGGDFVVRHMGDPMLLLSPAGRVVTANPAARAVLRCPVDAAIGAPAAEVVDGWGQLDAAGDDLPLVTSGVGDHWRCWEVRVTPVPAVDGSTGRLLVFHDVTARERLEAYLQQRALSDPLTGLPNRRLLSDRVEHALQRSLRTGEWLAVLFCDLDDFKAVNDTLGHDRGDELLQEVARRLSASVRAADTVARLGGDEFVVLLEGLPDPGGAEELAGRLAERLAEPIELGPHRLTAPASLGLAVARGGETSAQELLRAADRAMYTVKGDPDQRVGMAGPGDG